MAALQLPHRPDPTTDPRPAHPARNVGLALGLVGMTLVGIATVANFAAAAGLDTDPAGAEGILAWTGGLTTLGLGSVKFGIALILVAIIHHLWLRVEAVGASLAHLHPVADATVEVDGEIETEHGRATISRDPPEPLGLHQMARTMWAPMLGMGVMALGAGFVVSLFQQAETVGTETFRQLGAWKDGLEFLGEGFLLSGISFLLGTILYGLRTGGGEVQARLGLPVHTLEMPATVKAFVGLMMLGLMAAIAQFVLFVYMAASVADDPASFASWASWVAPLRFVALGIILAGITLALVSIAKVLGFQFSRIRDIVTGPRAQEVATS